jgi:hypothetical protein
MDIYTNHYTGLYVEKSPEQFYRLSGSGFSSRVPSPIRLGILFRQYGDTTLGK